MESGTRSGFLISGSVIAFIGFVFPGLYGITYAPPANAGLPAADSDQVHAFLGSLQVYNGFDGPYDFKGLFISIIVMFALGIATRFMDFGTAYALLGRAQRIAHVAHHSIGLLSGLSVIAIFIWQFRYGDTPVSIQERFVTAVGGGKAAVEASHYVTASLGLTALIVLFGFLIGLIGVYPKIFGIITALAIIGFIVLIIVAR